MKKMYILLFSSLYGLFICTACQSAGTPIVSTPLPISTPRPTVEKKSLPTPMSPSQMVVYDDLQVVMREAEITTSYLTEYGSNREPPMGKKIISGGKPDQEPGQ